MGIEVRALTQFRVLGPLEVSHDGTAVRLGGERQRALLALLLTHANELSVSDGTGSPTTLGGNCHGVPR